MHSIITLNLQNGRGLCFEFLMRCWVCVIRGFGVCSVYCDLMRLPCFLFSCRVVLACSHLLIYDFVWSSNRGHFMFSFLVVS